MTLMWKTTARVQSEGDAHVQEDACGFVGDTAWVIDGATQLLGPLHLPAASDPQWLATALSAALSDAAPTCAADAAPTAPADANAADAAPIARVRARLAAALARIDAQATALVGAERVRFPSAAVSVAQLNADGVAIAALADCTVVVRTHDGAHHVVCAAPADARVDALAAGVDPAARRELLRQDRAQRNTPGRLWVARREPAAAEHAVVVQLGHPERIVLASDGAWRAVELGLVSGPEEFLTRTASTLAALELLHELRAHQAVLGETADDATILSLVPAA